LDDDSVGFLDVFLIEQVLQLKDPLLPGGPRERISTSVAETRAVRL
jgi:hypothetical protein